MATAKKEAKQAIEVLLDRVDWNEVPKPEPILDQESLPYVTHEGILKLGEMEFRVFQLSDGMRVIDAEDLAKWFNVGP